MSNKKYRKSIKTKTCHQSPGSATCLHTCHHLGVTAQPDVDQPTACTIKFSKPSSCSHDFVVMVFSFCLSGYTHSANLSGFRSFGRRAGKWRVALTFLRSFYGLIPLGLGKREWTERDGFRSAMHASYLRIGRNTGSFCGHFRECLNLHMHHAHVSFLCLYHGVQRAGRTQAEPSVNSSQLGVRPGSGWWIWRPEAGAVAWVSILNYSSSR